MIHWEAFKNWLFIVGVLAFVCTLVWCLWLAIVALGFKLVFASIAGAVIFAVTVVWAYGWAQAGQTHPKRG